MFIQSETDVLILQLLFLVIKYRTLKNTLCGRHEYKIQSKFFKFFKRSFLNKCPVDVLLTLYTC